MEDLLDENRNRKKWPSESIGQSFGLACRKCGCRHLYVDNTRRVANMIVRYRRCRNCGHRMTTCERAVAGA